MANGSKALRPCPCSSLLNCYDQITFAAPHHCSAMSPRTRNIIAVLSGVVAGALLITLSQFLNSRLFPLPAGTNPNDEASLVAAVQQMPTGAFLGLIIGYFVGTTAGCYTALRLAADNPIARARMVALVFVIGGVLNFRTIPHPTWVVLGSFAAFIVAPFVAGILVRKEVPA